MWAFEIGIAAMLLKLSLISSHLDLPRQGRLEQEMHTFGRHKQNKNLSLSLDSDNPQISPNEFKSYDWFYFYREAEEAMPEITPEYRGLPMCTCLFVDDNLNGNESNKTSQKRASIF